jgi:hypothetical protein
MNDKEICICAAILTDEGRIIRGHRHHNCRDTAIGMRLTVNSHYSRQGFITSWNNFVGRELAYKLQIEAGIPSVAPGGYRGEQLFSEDLY